MSPTQSRDVAVVGGGPAALCIAAALAEQQLEVTLVAPSDPATPWPNTYGIWGEEVDALGLGSLLEHRWSNTVSYFGSGDADDQGQIFHGRDYGLFDKQALQQHWLDGLSAGGVQHCNDMVQSVEHGPDGATLITASGDNLRARLVVDASGHDPALVSRPSDGLVAGQAAYGVVGRFSQPPVDPDQFVLMDYRCDHLSSEQRQQAPTFLYAMDLGEGRFFVEETSLAAAPALSFVGLQQRLEQRLAHRGIAIEAVEHVEHCLFPMNPALPDRRQPVVGFGGAASMVHPASGYMIGSLLRRGPQLAADLAAAMAAGQQGLALSQVGWQSLWPAELRRRHGLYRFGLEKLMRFDEAQLRAFFATFFALPNEQWFGFLANTLETPQLLQTMLQLFGSAPNAVRWGLMEPRGRELNLMTRMLRW